MSAMIATAVLLAAVIVWLLLVERRITRLEEELRSMARMEAETFNRIGRIEDELAGRRTA